MAFFKPSSAPPRTAHWQPATKVATQPSRCPISWRLPPDEHDAVLKAQLADARAALEERHLWDAVDAVDADAVATGLLGPARLKEIVGPRLERWRSESR